MTAQPTTKESNMTDTSALRALAGLLDEIDRLREDNAVLSGQVARVQALHQPDWSDWGSDHPEENASCSCGVNYDHADCPTVQALAIPAEGGE